MPLRAAAQIIAKEEIVLILPTIAELSGVGYAPRPSIGIAVFLADGADATALMANADAALHRAKADGRGIVRFFDRDTDTAARERRTLRHELQASMRAVHRNRRRADRICESGIIGGFP